MPSTKLDSRWVMALCGYVLCGTALAQEHKPCGESTELECLNSDRCTLVQRQEHGPYVCRDAVGRCEIGFRQGGDGDIKQVCESKPGCEFNPGNCFCPPNLNCACGGGPPPQCVERRSTRLPSIDKQTAAGTCLIGVCVDAKGAERELKARLGDGALADGGYARCFYLPAQQLFAAAGVEPSAPPGHRIDWVYLGRYSWPDCHHNTRVNVADDLLATAEGLRVGDAEQDALGLYQTMTGFEMETAGAERILMFRPQANLVTEIGLMTGHVVTLQVSHSQ